MGVVVRGRICGDEFWTRIEEELLERGDALLPET